MDNCFNLLVEQLLEKIGDSEDKTAARGAVSHLAGLAGTALGAAAGVYVPPKVGKWLTRSAFNTADKHKLEKERATKKEESKRRAESLKTKQAAKSKADRELAEKQLVRSGTTSDAFDTFINILIARRSLPAITGDSTKRDLLEAIGIYFRGAVTSMRFSPPAVATMSSPVSALASATNVGTGTSTWKFIEDLRSEGNIRNYNISFRDLLRVLNLILNRSLT